MNKLRQSKLGRYLVSILALLSLALSGVAFAGLQSQLNVVRGNFIQTATANVQVSPDGNTYGNTMDGFVFDNLIPGGAPVPSSSGFGYHVYAKNVGTTPVALKVSVSSPVTNPDNVDLSKVHVYFSSFSGNLNATLQDLITANSSGGLAIDAVSRLTPSQVINFTIQVSLDANALTGPSASLSNIDFNFGAVAVN